MKLKAGMGSNRFIPPVSTFIKEGRRCGGSWGASVKSGEQQERVATREGGDDERVSYACMKML